MPDLFLRSLCVGFLIATLASTLAAQVAPATGTVKLKQADGTEVPVSGAQIDIYRTDIKQEYHTRTDRNGRYLQPGLPFIGTYTVIVSAPGAKPAYASKLRYKQIQQQDFLLTPGDGSTLTLDQVKAADLTAPTPTTAQPERTESAEVRAKREEMERKIAEVQKQNEEITKANEFVSNSFRSGNEALNAGRLDEAITQFRAGLDARPDEPALLTNLSEALRRRGVNRFNEGIKQTNNDAKERLIESGKKDWTDAADLAFKAVRIIKASPAEPERQAIYDQNKLAAVTTRALAMKLVASKVDQTQAEAAWDAYQDYIALEADPLKKTKLKGDAMQTLFDAGNVDLSVRYAKAMLKEDPDNLDAHRVLGLSLFASNDEANFQEAANHLQRYVEKAPDTDPLKASVKDALDFLKSAKNITPQPATATRPVGRRH